MSRQTGAVVGLSLVIIGGATLLDQQVKTGKPSSIAIILVALIFVSAGVYRRRLGYLIPGSLMIGLGCGVFGMLNIAEKASTLGRIGILLFCFGIGWLLITLVSLLVFPRTAWWALVPGAIISSAGACFLFSEARLVDFILYVLVGLSLAFLLWGGNNRLAGLIIPGCILLGVGLGIFIAWGTPHESNSLSRTGMMLVWFALGWGFISLFFRVSFNRFIWWPLIPAGILAVVGLGLYLGGNPGNTVSFIGNTGSLGLLIFGLYLLLMRSGIRH